MGGGPEDHEHFTEHLLLTLPFPEPVDLLNSIRKKFPYIRVSYIGLANTFMTFSEEAENSGIYNDITILVTLACLPQSPEECPKLKFIHFISAGTNHVVTHPIYTDTNIPLTTSSGVHGPPIAEWVTMTSLAASHHYDVMYEWQKDHEWGQHKYIQNHQVLTKGFDNVGQRIGILGYGSIGRQVARVCNAMGMTVVAYTASPRETPSSKHDHGFIVPGTGDPDGSIPVAWFSGLSKPELHNFLSQHFDHLLIAVPLTDQTRHFLGDEEFRILAKSSSGKQTKTGGCFLTNISRGLILDQEALIDALNRGPEKEGLRGAALDVTEPEPLPSDHPLWDTKNVIVTPHISALGVEYFERSIMVLEENMSLREKGEKMINVVNRRRGY
ncbi:MAG: hypothetical protein M1834_001640 [Cirrosporium novae-zelandiae]|nr:MAG: hypothetical protein M1834_004157 [Cirrosporium novae-zelandiae]KAI9735624.1 MAG: hypothetical protein M1834_001640 [Cirrosporium novae-zelandiae]